MSRCFLKPQSECVGFYCHFSVLQLHHTTSASSGLKILAWQGTQLSTEKFERLIWIPLPLQSPKNVSNDSGPIPSQLRLRAARSSDCSSHRTLRPLHSLLVILHLDLDQGTALLSFQECFLFSAEAGRNMMFNYMYWSSIVVIMSGLPDHCGQPGAEMGQ